MDQQRPLLYLLLVFLGFLIWNQWQMDKMPKPEPLPNQFTNTQNDTAVSASAVAQGSYSADVPQQTVQSADGVTVVQTESTANANSQLIHVKTDTLDLTINTRGGDIIRSALPTYPISIKEPDTPVVIHDPARGYVAQSGLGHKNVAGTDAASLAPNHYAVFTTPKNEYILGDGEDTLVVPLTWSNGAGVTVTKRYTFTRGHFEINVEQEVANQSGNTWSGFEYRQLRHGPPVAVTGGIFGGVASFNGAAYYDYSAEDGYSYEKIPFKDFEDEDEVLNKTIKGGWAAILEKYFVSAWIPQQDKNNTFYTNLVQENGFQDSHIIGLKTPVIEIANGANHTFASKFYVGPKIQRNLEELAPGLELTVDYGVFSFISKPLFWLLDHLHSLFGNWGWAIIFITVIIKIIFFWPSAVSYKSMAKLKKLTPKMKEMQERYKNDPQAKQKAMMDFYRKEKINPLGGCLPMLIQIPVFMGLYWVLLESVELRQAPWLLWYKDLSIMDPTFILPLLMGASMWFQQKLNPPQLDEMQRKIFTWLPVVFTVMFLWFPAGLVLYWVVNNVLSMAQQWYINKKIIGDQ